MKRLLCFLCMLSLITSTGLVNAANYVPPTPRPPLRPPVKEEKAEKDTDYYKMHDVQLVDGLLLEDRDTLAKIEDSSDIIVEGKVVGDSEEVLEYTPDGLYIFYGYMLSTIKIDKVHKGNVTIGDTVIVAEPYYIKDNTVYHNSLYHPSDENKSYIWFLVDKRPNFEHYSLAMWERGRYPILNSNTRSLNQLDNLTRQDLNLGLSRSGKGEEVYRDIFEDVVAKYMNGSAG